MYYEKPILSKGLKYLCVLKFPGGGAGLLMKLEILLLIAQAQRIGCCYNLGNNRDPVQKAKKFLIG